uniref:translation initiation factor IF-2-like n=1 Tax=Ictidomys tridecemlineatus TaxID=43179 RepID=UPI001A9F36CE|nr:translation initiation factor IF-2-like [Ictidomys tridecemlineatus]
MWGGRPHAASSRSAPLSRLAPALGSPAAKGARTNLERGVISAKSVRELAVRQPRARQKPEQRARGEKPSPGQPAHCTATRGSARPCLDRQPPAASSSRSAESPRAGGRGGGGNPGRPLLPPSPPALRASAWGKRNALASSWALKTRERRFPLLAWMRVFADGRYFFLLEPVGFGKTNSWFSASLLCVPSGVRGLKPSASLRCPQLPSQGSHGNSCQASSLSRCYYHCSLSLGSLEGFC